MIRRGAGRGSSLSTWVGWSNWLTSTFHAKPKRFGVLLFLALVCLVGLNSVEREPRHEYKGSRRLLSAEEDLGERVGEILHSFPHISFQFVWSTGQFDPGRQYYLESLGVMVLPFFIIAFALFLMGGIYSCYVLFFYTDVMSGYRYSALERSWPRLLLIGVAIIMLLVIGAGLWATVAVQEGIPYIQDRMEDGAVLFKTRQLKVDGPLKLLSDYINATDEFIQFGNDVDKYIDKIHEIKPHVDDGELAREIIVFVLYGLVVVGCVLGLASAIFSWGIPSLIVAILLWGTFCLMWVVCGLHLAGSVGAGDVCETSDDFFEYYWFDDSSEKNYTYIAYYIKCDTNASSTPRPSQLRLNSMSHNSDEAEEDEADDVGAGADDRGIEDDYVQPFKNLPSLSSSSTLKPAVQSDLATNDDTGVGAETGGQNLALATKNRHLLTYTSTPFTSLQLEAVDVLNNAKIELQKAQQNNDTDGIKHWTYVVQVSTALVLAIDELQDCTETRRIYDDALNRLCSDTILGLTTVVSTQIILGLLGFVVIITALLGWKRFPQPGEFRNEGSEILPIEEAKFSPRFDPINFAEERKQLLED
jgi:hypothetical protein